MSPRTGRPRKEITKSVNLGLRLTEETAAKLQRCADALGISRTEVIEIECWPTLASNTNTL